MAVFELYDIVNACYMGKDHIDRQRLHTDRSSHGFVYFRNGENIYDFKGGKRVLAGTGCFLYLPKNSTYTVSSKYRGEVYCINFLCNDDVFGSKYPNESSFSFYIKRQTYVESIYKKVIREMYLKKPYYELTVKSLIYELAAIIFTEMSSEYIPSSGGTKLEPAVRYINEHYTENNIKIPDLASLCGMSENYFRRLFTKKFGISPVKYINERRINYASDFLKSGLYSVSEVALLSGFDDLGYFSRTYKKVKGEMPSETKNNK